MAEERMDIDALNVDELKEELKKLNLRISSSKAVLRERLREFTRKVESSAKKKNERKSKNGEERDGDF